MRVVREATSRRSFLAAFVSATVLAGVGASAAAAASVDARARASDSTDGWTSAAHAPQQFAPLRLRRPPIRSFRLPRIRVRIPPTPVTPWRFVVIDLSLAPTPLSAQRALIRLYRRDGYKRVLVDAFCNGMVWLDQQPEGTRVTAANWRAYLMDYFYYWWRQHLQRYIKPRIVQSVEGWLDAWDMAQVSPSRAYVYARACLG